MINFVYVLGIIIDSFIVYTSLLVLDKKYQLGITNDRKVITSKPVWIVLVLNAVVTLIYSIYRFDDDGAWRYILFVLSVAFMGILAITDSIKKVIPNSVVMSALCIFIVVITIGLMNDIDEGIQVMGISLAGGAFAGISFMICYIISKKSVGGGDIKMATVLGLFVGGQYILLDLFVGILCCAIYSAIMIIRKRLTVKDGVPLAPFLYMGTLFVLLF